MSKKSLLKMSIIFEVSLSQMYKNPEGQQGQQGQQGQGPDVGCLSQFGGLYIIRQNMYVYINIYIYICLYTYI